MRFADLLRADKAGPAGIRAALERAEAEGQAASARLDGLTAERARALVEDDDAALDRIEAEIAKARRDLDRADLAAEELRRRLADAEAAERQARLDEAHARGEAARDKAVGLVRRYGKAALELKNLMAELADLDAQVETANRELAAAGDGRRIVDSDTVARPDGDMRVLREAINVRVMLPSSVDPVRYLYPPGRTVFGTFEPEQNWPAR